MGKLKVAWQTRRCKFVALQAVLNTNEGKNMHLRSPERSAEDVPCSKHTEGRTSCCGNSRMDARKGNTTTETKTQTIANRHNTDVTTIQHP